MDTVVARFRSFVSWDIESPNPHSMAFGGFVRSDGGVNDEKYSYCEHCLLILTDEFLRLHPDLHPHQYHHACNPECYFIKNYKDPRIFDDFESEHDNLLVKHYPPKHLQYCHVERRAETFNEEMDQELSNRLCKAGFFYYQDNFICFYCSVYIFGQDIYDDPWEVHARYSPHCPFVRMHNDLYFITQAVSKYYRSNVYWVKYMTEVNTLFTSGDLRNIVLHLLRLEDLNLTTPQNVASFVEFVRYGQLHMMCMSNEDSFAQFISYEKPELFIKARNVPPYSTVPHVYNCFRNMLYKNVNVKKPGFIQTNIPTCIVCKIRVANIVIIPCKHCITCFECMCILRKCITCRRKIHYTMQICYS